MPRTGANNDLKNVIYRRLKQELISCHYQPDTMLNETMLASEFGSSRTPIREALYRLEQEGLVEIIPKRGIHVTNITLQSVIHVFQVREEIEPHTLRMAIPHIEKSVLEELLETFQSPVTDMETAFWDDIDMHMYFVRHCGNPFFIDLMDKVFSQSTRISIATHQSKEKLSRARNEHVGILTALLENRPDDACQLMYEHLTACKEYSLNYFSAVRNENELSKLWDDSLGCIPTRSFP